MQQCCAPTQYLTYHTNLSQEVIGILVISVASYEAMKSFLVWYFGMGLRSKVEVGRAQKI